MSERGGLAGHWHWLIPIALATYFGCVVVVGHGWAISVPAERDRRLVGRWSGAWEPPGLSVPRTLVFAANGDWSDDRRRLGGPRGSIWGTEGGRLHVKWLATDAWIGKAFPYAVSDDGRTLRLVRPERFGYLFPSVLWRVDETPKAGQAGGPSTMPERRKADGP